MEPTLFAALGGEQELRSIVDRFVDRLFDDLMIGFLFRRASRERIKRFEYEHAAAFLGAGVDYTGRALDEVHRPHRIMGGHFDRRKEILRQVLVERDAPLAVREAWLEHTEALRAMITGDPRGRCDGAPAQ